VSDLLGAVFIIIVLLPAYYWLMGTLIEGPWWLACWIWRKLRA